MSLPSSQAKRGSDALVVQSVAKAFRVLTVFDKGRGALTLSQIARATGLDVSTVQRFTHTLTQLGYLHKDPATRRFELAVKTLDLAYHYIRGSRLVERAVPVLLQLSKQTEEAVSLTVLDGTEVVFVLRYLSRRVLNTDVVAGTRLPAYCTAPGRAMLARLPEATVSAILDASALRAYTPATPTDRAELLARIDTARQHGYAAAFDEIYHGDASVAAPIVNADGQAIAAVNVAALLARINRTQFLDTYAHQVTLAARSISD